MPAARRRTRHQPARAETHEPPAPAGRVCAQAALCGPLLACRGLPVRGASGRPACVDTPGTVDLGSAEAARQATCCMPPTWNLLPGPLLPQPACHPSPLPAARQVVVFTASLGKYAGPLLDLLDKAGVVRWRLFREACYPYEARLGRCGAAWWSVERAHGCSAAPMRLAMPLQAPLWQACAGAPCTLLLSLPPPPPPPPPSPLCTGFLCVSRTCSACGATWRRPPHSAQAAPLSPPCCRVLTSRTCSAWGATLRRPSSSTTRRTRTCSSRRTRCPLGPSSTTCRTRCVCGGGGGGGVCVCGGGGGGHLY